MIKIQLFVRAKSDHDLDPDLHGSGYWFGSLDPDPDPDPHWVKSWIRNTAYFNSWLYNDPISHIKSYPPILTSCPLQLPSTDTHRESYTDNFKAFMWWLDLALFSITPRLKLKRWFAQSGFPTLHPQFHSKVARWTTSNYAAIPELWCCEMLLIMDLCCCTMWPLLLQDVATNDLWCCKILLSLICAVAKYDCHLSLLWQNIHWKKHKKFFPHI